MAYAIVIDNTPAEWDGRSWRDSQGRSHPANAPSLYSEAERETADMYEIIETAIPDGQVSTGYTLEWDAEEGTVTRVHTTVDAPTPSPVATPPQVKACALRVNVDGDEVTGLSGAFNILGIVKLDTGTFWCLLESEVAGDQPELVPNNGIHISITEWYGTDFYIECRDHAGGTVIDPVSFGFTIYQFS